MTGMPDSDLVITKPDPADNAKQAAEKLVWSFLVLFENLVSARTLLKSLQEATLLVTPALGQPALAKGTETSTAEAFVKKLQVRDTLTGVCISGDSVCLPCLHLALPVLTNLHPRLCPMSAIVYNCSSHQSVLACLQFAFAVCNDDSLAHLAFSVSAAASNPFLLAKDM